MILATHKCGCPPPPMKPPCSPCCAPLNNLSSKTREKCPTSACCSKPPPKPVKRKLSDPPPCCPTLPVKEEFERPQLIRSEIEERGLPYKEIEAVINNNRLVIRTQKESPKPEYDPPCDCMEDPSLPSVQKEEICEESDRTLAPGNRVVTLFPRIKDLNNGAEQSNRNNLETGSGGRTIDLEENPNIFLFRVKKKCADGDKKFNIDLEFKTARPWSAKKRMEHEEIRKSTIRVDVSEEKEERSEKKQSRVGKRRKKK
ncbi:hypothetical protein WH47_04970 [Habropoda laboriosa]|uniref:Uncharacterized protein n=1 Tax=Habropoda laboriosa TaxID=597456 RepID=A0A0L7RJH2_9HYME|nr:PREDICTED: uncharacterized protein LOC108580083 [Habropoda laboriosa]KOC70984.1 hypothetical protein WH47_04970 [Habropoda laboriosa]